MPKISVSVAKSLLEAAGVKPEEAPAMVKELIVMWANLRGRLAGRRKVIETLRDRVKRKISEITHALAYKEDGTLDYTECVRKGILTKLLSALEEADLLLEILKDVETDEARKVQCVLQQGHIKLIRRRVEYLHRLIVDLTSDALKGERKCVEEILTDTVLDTIITVLMAMGTALSLERVLLVGEKIAKETEEDLMKYLQVLEKKIGKISKEINLPTTL